MTENDKKNALDAASEMFEAIPKNKRMEYLGHLNDVCLALQKLPADYQR